MSLLTANEVAVILKVSKARVYELARTGSLPSITLGQRQLRFDQEALQRWLNSAVTESANVKGGQA
jgi:excisionase family DNA binding protein